MTAYDEEEKAKIVAKLIGDYRKELDMLSLAELRAHLQTQTYVSSMTDKQWRDAMRTK